jgi:hypothetical protein
MGKGLKDRRVLVRQPSAAQKRSFAGGSGQGFAPPSSLGAYQQIADAIVYAAIWFSKACGSKPRLRAAECAPKD